MSTIRPFQRTDLHEVADLYELVVRSGRSNSPPGLGPYFARTLLDHPWADAEIPSLVQTSAGGSIIAFQGSSVRRAVFDGTPIRIACAGQLVAHPEARRQAAGAHLVDAYLRGPQDLTITDGATDQMRQLWTLLGGKTAHLECVEWVRVLRPMPLAADLLARRRGFRSRRPARRRGYVTFDRSVARWPRLRPQSTPSDVVAMPLTPADLIEHLSVVTQSLRLSVAYDDRYLDWLFGELKAVKVRGELIARLIRESPSGRVLGWYVYYLLAGGVAEVLQVAAGGRDVGRVIDDLLDNAWSGGAAAIRGRVEPRLLEPLARRKCLLRYTGGALIHSNNAEIVGTIASGDSLLTRLDGEWWMGHHVLAFDRRA